MVNGLYIKNAFKETFTIDARSVILCRIMTGLSAIYIFYVYFINIELLAPEENFYKNPYFHNPSVFLNLFILNESALFIKVCLMAAVTMSTLFIVGIGTRTFAVLIGLILISVKNQTGFSSIGFELLLLVILFWSLFFPHQKINLLWDRNLKSHQSQPVIAFAWYLQIVLFYFFTFLYKADFPEWSGNFNALYIIFQKVNYQTFLTPWILNFPNFLKILVLLTLFLEGVAPFLFLMTARKCIPRMSFIVLYIFFHIGIMLLLDVGAFSPLSIALWMSLIPTEFWNKFQFTRRESEFEDRNRNAKAISIFILTSAIAIVYGNTFMYVNRNYVTSQVGGPVYQKWIMFANESSLSSNIAWLATEATLEGATQIPELWDVMNNIPADHNYPLDKSAKYKTYIWRTFTGRIIGTLSNNERLIKTIPKYFCKAWNETHERKVTSVKFVVVVTKVQMQNQDKSPKRVRELSRADCTLSQI